MYLDLMNRQSANESIDRGAGLLFGAFAAPQDRGPMLHAMTGQNGGPVDAGSVIENIMKINQTQIAMQQQRAFLATLPTLAAKLKMDPMQVLALYQTGKLGDVLQKAGEESLPSVAAVTGKNISDTAKTNAEVAGTLPDDQMRELTALNATRKAQNLPPLDILSYKMFSQPLDPAMRAYYMAHPEMMPSGTGMNGVTPGAPGAGSPGMAVGGPPANGAPAPAQAVPPPFGGVAPVSGGPTNVLPSFDEAKKSNFNNIPPVMPKLVTVPPVQGESMQQWQARQAHVDFH